jgi:uncharacterized protein (TIGR00290 family)
MEKAYLNWSSGKDAAFALYSLQQKGGLKIGKLVTTMNTEVDRISMHGVRRELLEQQAKSIGLPLHQISLPGNVSMTTYNRIMQEQVELLKKEGYTHSVFGDIFLEDLKAYREEQLEKEGVTAVFPLWKRDTRKLMQEFLEADFKAICVCVNAKVLDESFCGRIIDQNFIDSLPEGVDPCGENGEFHTFVFDGPIFRDPIKFKIGEKVQRSYQPSEKEEDNCFADEEKSWDTGFWYCDLIPV